MDEGTEDRVKKGRGCLQFSDKDNTSEGSFRQFVNKLQTLASCREQAT